MMKRNLVYGLPGLTASIVMIAATLLWTYWGAGEMYHEGWWGAWVNRLPYMTPIAVTLIPALLAFRWPMAGGTMIGLVGCFALFFFKGSAGVFGLIIALVGAAFLTDGILRRRYPQAFEADRLMTRLERWRSPFTLGTSLIVFAGMSVAMLPIVLTRQDDGIRDARLVKGNDLTLVWAPEGPGWNWQQPWGGYPSWQSIALYGVPPVGLDEKPGYGRDTEEQDRWTYAAEDDMMRTNLCQYLNDAGTALMDEPQHIWRMPTTDEIARSLVRHGENAGCKWEGGFGVRMACSITPDKESPLWSTDVPVIYYWTADSYNDERGIFVAYNGTVNATRKTGGNPRHGYRCVREP